MALFVGLAALQFDSINSALVGERLMVLAERTAGPFRSAARIGLPLSTVRNAGALLEGARQTDDAIRAIHVFDAEGRIVHSTDAHPAAMIPAQAAAARSKAAGESWHAATAEGFLSSIDIASRSGGTAGGILIVYPGRGNVTQVRAMTAELGLGAIAVMLVSAAISALLLRLGLGRQIRQFEAVDGAIDDFERVAWRSAAAGPAAAPMGEGDTSELRRLLREAETRYRATGREIAAATEGAE